MLVVVAAGDAVVASQGSVFSGLVYAELVWMNSVFARKNCKHSENWYTYTFAATVCISFHCFWYYMRAYTSAP
jgi:hypothetical protein